jgi:hypothetical protein
MKDSFVVYRSFHLALSTLSNKDRLKLYDAIFEFGLNHNEIDLEHLPKAMFHLIKPQLEANHRKYLNGKLGGRGNKAKRKQNESKPKANEKQNESKTLANGNANVNVNNNVNNNVGLPLKDNGQEVNLDPDFLQELHQAYPSVALHEELVKMRVWLVANPSKRKTARGMPRFVTNWLSRVQNNTPTETDSYANIHKAVLERKNVRK